MEVLPPAAWAAVAAVVSGVVGVISGRSGNKADAASALTGAAVQVVNELQEEVGRLRDRLAAIEAEVIDCERRYEELKAQFDQSGG